LHRFDLLGVRHSHVDVLLQKGVNTMKMMSRTRTTSTSGVTLMSEFGRPTGLTRNFFLLL